ncbi:DMT family transporter [Nocardia yamanashiensis]|uniref:DMT family transporter n=1 Tax=Nocardia yamanashiensis TaxID=209247 RepID=UPI001E2B6D1F|nr:DMT family transporter [Nocardia yamanashiensis]UGT45408.1 DMT family transporter [Nocardia yamanashiensis]
MPNHPVGAIACALLAALLFAIAAVAQQRAAASVAADQPLIGSLIRNPRWWAGMVGDAGGYGMQVAALALGAVLLVQPILVSALVFALPLAARLNGRRITGRELGMAVALTAALVCFVVIGNPTEGNSTAPLRDWLIPLAVLLGAVAISVAAAEAPQIRRRAGAGEQATLRRRGGLLGAGERATLPSRAEGGRQLGAGERALLLGAGGGALFGLAAALTSYVTDLFEHGVAEVLSSWQTWALVASGAVGLYLQQRAYQVGPLAASLPAVTIAEPLAAAFLGRTVLDERLRAHGFGLLVTALAVLVMCVTAVGLSRSQAAPG